MGKNKKGGGAARGGAAPIELSFRYASAVHEDHRTATVVRRDAKGDYVTDTAAGRHPAASAHPGVTVGAAEAKQAFMLATFRYYLRPAPFYHSHAERVEDLECGGGLGAAERHSLIDACVVDDFPPNDDGAGAVLASALLNPRQVLPWAHVIMVEAALDAGHMECPICLEPFTAPRMTECGHVFCFHCILRSMNAQKHLGPGYAGLSSEGAAGVASPPSFPPALPTFGASGSPGTGAATAAALVVMPAGNATIATPSSTAAKADRPRTCPLCSVRVSLGSLRPVRITLRQPLQERASAAFVLTARHRSSCVEFSVQNVEAARQTLLTNPLLVLTEVPAGADSVSCGLSPAPSRYVHASADLLRQCVAQDTLDIQQALRVCAAGGGGGGGGDGSGDGSGGNDEGVRYEMAALNGALTHLATRGYRTLDIGASPPRALQAPSSAHVRDATGDEVLFYYKHDGGLAFLDAVNVAMLKQAAADAGRGLVTAVRVPVLQLGTTMQRGRDGTLPRLFDHVPLYANVHTAIADLARVVPRDVVRAFAPAMAKRLHHHGHPSAASERRTQPAKGGADSTVTSGGSSPAVRPAAGSVPVSPSIAASDPSAVRPHSDAEMAMVLDDLTPEELAWLTAEASGPATPGLQEAYAAPYAAPSATTTSNSNHTSSSTRQDGSSSSSGGVQAAYVGDYAGALTGVAMGVRITDEASFPALGGTPHTAPSALATATNPPIATDAVAKATRPAWVGAALARHQQQLPPAAFSSSNTRVVPAVAATASPLLRQGSAAGFAREHSSPQLHFLSSDPCSQDNEDAERDDECRRRKGRKRWNVVTNGSMKEK